MDGAHVTQMAPGVAGRPDARQINDAPLRAALENRRDRPLDEAISAVCYTHGVRLALAGQPLPAWRATAPRWAREALRTGHANGTTIAGRTEQVP